MSRSPAAGRPFTVRPESPDDAAAIRQVVLAAFPDDDEAVLVDALRADPAAWLDGLSLLAEEQTPDGSRRVIGHALLTRCHVGAAPALCLAPCSVLPERQRSGVGTAVTEAALRAAREAGEALVVVLGHPEYYPRFGFERASGYGIHLSVEVPDEALMVQRLDPTVPVPAGRVRYAAAFGI